MPTATIAVDEALKARPSRPASRIWQVRRDRGSTILSKPCFAAWPMQTFVSNGAFPCFRRGPARPRAESRGC
jgi:hypothetical protein